MYTIEYSADQFAVIAVAAVVGLGGIAWLSARISARENVAFWRVVTGIKRLKFEKVLSSGEQLLFVFFFLLPFVAALTAMFFMGDAPRVVER